MRDKLHKIYGIVHNKTTNRNKIAKLRELTPMVSKRKTSRLFLE